MAGGALRRHAHLFRIGDWVVDPPANTLRTDGRSTRLEPRVMDVLVLLAERAGRVVSRDELLANAWPGLVVGDEALSQSIIKLRRALGDQTRAPTYIETIAKRGYRLIAPVTPCAEAGAAESSGPVAPPELDERMGPGTKRPPRVTRAGLRSMAVLRSPRRVALMAIALALVAVAAFHGRGLVLIPEAVDGDQARQAPWITISVLPFESLDADRDHDYVARGISDNLTTDLSRLSALRVIQEPDGTPPVPGADAARYRITGSVQRGTQMLRINVRVTDAATREQVWAGRLEHAATDLLAAQDALTRALVEVLPAKVNDVERRRLAKRYTSSPDAYDEFLRAQALFLVRRSDANDDARTLYRAAVQRDPRFARAYAGLALTYAMDVRLRRDADAAPSLARAFALAETARSIDPDLAEPYWALGFVQAQGRRHAEAIASLRRAIDLNPSFADAYALLGGIETYVGRPAASIPLLHTAMRLNPGGGYLYFLLLGRAYLFENDIEQALLNLRAAASRNPADLETRVYLAAALAAAGDARAARWEADEIRSLQPGFSTTRWLATYPATSDDVTRRLAAWLAPAGL